MTVAEELRALAFEIEEVCRRSPACSMAWDSVWHLTGHLTLMAQVSEMTGAEHDARESKQAHLDGAAGSGANGGGSIEHDGGGLG